MFLPFLKLPIVLPGNPEEKDTDKEVELNIQPVEIASFHEGHYWGTLITLKCGQTYISKLEPKQIESALAGYWMHLSKQHQDKKGGSILTLS